MESSSFENIAVARNCLTKMIKACENLLLWNEQVQSAEDYLKSPWGMEKLAASSMLIEAIGEGAKKT